MFRLKKNIYIYKKILYYLLYFYYSLIRYFIDINEQCLFLIFFLNWYRKILEKWLIQNNLKNFYPIIFIQDSTERIDERKIKVIGHSLKILDKLFATYCPYVNNEILSFAIELLSKVHKYISFTIIFLPSFRLIFKSLFTPSISLGVPPYAWKNQRLTIN